MPRSVVRASRVITASLFGVRLLLLGRTIEAAAMQSAAPVDDAFFPAILKHPVVLLLAMVVPLATGAVALIKPSAASLRVHAVVETTSAATLLVHQSTYFFATWVIDFWAGCFLLWLAWSRVNERGAHEKGPFLAQLIIALLFLGGAVGKWTAGYWSGEPFYDLFFRDNPSFLFALLRDRFDETTVRLLATAYSRIVVVVESTMSLVFLLPARAAAIASIVVALGMWAVSTDLFEVTVPIIGIACAGWILSAGSREDGHRLRPVGASTPPLRPGAQPGE